MQLAEIVITTGKHSGQVIPVTSNKFLIGRERDCHFRPDDELISRHHCVIRYDGITHRIRDLGSRNGSFVNGTLIHGEVVIVPDDIVKIGNVTFQLSLVSTKQNQDSETQLNSLNQTDVMEGKTLSNPKSDDSLGEETKDLLPPPKLSTSEESP